MSQKIKCFNPLKIGSIDTLINALYSITVNTHQFILLTHLQYIIPNRRYLLIKGFDFHIAKLDMYHSRRWCVEKYPMRKISIFGNNGQMMLFCIVPNFTIFHFWIDRHHLSTIQNSTANLHQ